MPRSLYRAEPPRELIEKAVRSLGIEGLNSSNWFDASTVVLPLQEEVKNELRPVFYKCMAKRYLDKENMTYKDYLLLVRQLLRHINRNLNRREKCIKVEENLYRYIPQYQLTPAPIPVEGVALTFN